MPNFTEGSTNPPVTIRDAHPDDSNLIAEIHLTARRIAMPYLRSAHSDAETRAWFAGIVANDHTNWSVAQVGPALVAYMRIDGAMLDHLYVLPDWQGRGIGTALLDKAKALSSAGLHLWTFQRNNKARRFYERHGFRVIATSPGDNEEGEPDVQYAWQPTCAGAAGQIFSL